MILKKTSKVIALILCSVNLFLAGLHRGFEIGHDESTKFFISGGSGYDLLANYYIYIFLLLVMFVIGQSMKKDVLSRVACFSTLILNIFLYRTIYLQKKIFIYNSDSFTKLLRDTIPLDLISFLVMITLLLFQIIMVFQHYSNWRSKNAEID